MRLVTARLLITSLALATAMVIAAWMGRRDRRATVVLALTSLVWLTADHGFEGPLLVQLSHTNGVVLSDLFGFAGLGVAGWQLVRRRCRSRVPDDGAASEPRTEETVRSAAR